MLQLSAGLDGRHKDLCPTTLPHTDPSIAQGQHKEGKSVEDHSSTDEVYHTEAEFANEVTMMLISPDWCLRLVPIPVPTGGEPSLLRVIIRSHSCLASSPVHTWWSEP